MNAKKLRELLEISSDKFSIFQDKSLLSQYSFSVNEFTSLISDFLSDEQKVQLFELEHFKKLNPFLKSSIIEVVSDDKMKLKCLSNPDFIKGFTEYELVNMIETLDDSSKMKILENPDFWKKYHTDFSCIIKSLGKENKREILSRKDFIEHELELDDYQIKDILISIKEEKTKLEMMDFYQLKNNHRLVL